MVGLNAIEFYLCAMDYNENKTERNFWAAAAWFGSTAFWLARAFIPA